MHRKMHRRFAILVAGAVGFLAACAEPPVPDERAASPAGRAGGQDSTAVLLSVGDIASCTSSGDEATAALLDRLPGTVATLGDHAYPGGRRRDFLFCYGPSWGRHRARTRPSPGNHDNSGYYWYFGQAAGDPGKGYYSYDLGAWHAVALNSRLPTTAESPQGRWLRADLAAHPARCTIAYWHTPRFNSGAAYGDAPALEPLWETLYEAGVDVVLNGHEHLYERFAPQTPSGVADPARGIRQFTVGTGGKNHYPIGARGPNSEAADPTAFGVLRLELAPRGYRWAFIDTRGVSRDTGSTACH